MEIKMNDEQVNQALQTAIMTAIGEQGQALIIKHAIDHLTSPSSYGDKRTPLQDVLYRAVDKIAEAVFKNKLENDPAFLAQIESLYADACKRVMGTENREKTVTKIVNAIDKALSDRY